MDNNSRRATEMKRTTRRTYVSAEAFVRAWQRGQTVADVVEELGLVSCGYASTRAAILRKKGVPLKMYQRGRGSPLDVKRLSEIARKSGAK